MSGEFLFRRNCVANDMGGLAQQETHRRLEIVIDQFLVGDLKIVACLRRAVDVATDRRKAAQMTYVAGLVVAAVFQGFGLQEFFGNVVEGATGLIVGILAGLPCRLD